MIEADIEASLAELAKFREPSVFFGTPEEDVQDWFTRFVEPADVNKWKSDKLSYVKFYLEGTARQWFRVRKPRNCEDFKELFVETFKQKHFKWRVEVRLRSRSQGPNEPVVTYFYDVLNLCRQVELEQEVEMPELTKVEHLLRGLTPVLSEKLWPLVPDPISNTTQFLSAVTRYSQAREIAGNRDWAEELENPSLKINAVDNSHPASMITREEFDKQGTELRRIIGDLKKELLQRDSRINPNHQRTGNRVSFQRNAPQRKNYSPPPRGQSYGNTQKPRFESKRTTDGRPICNRCNKPGHIARFCGQGNPNGSNYTSNPRFNQNSYVNRQLNYLTISGDQLVTENVTCNGVKAKALIDTGAAVTAVSDKFARYLPESIQQWNGPNVRLADGQIISPKQGI